jgi:hypothetical protein
MSESVSLSGDLVLDLSGLEVYDGMTFTLINASSIGGQWQSVVATDTSDCTEYQVNVKYTEQFVTATLSSVSLCASASKLVACYALLQ